MSRSSSHLTTHLNSAYISAANRLQSRASRHKIVVYVESYDDIFFWNDLLTLVEDDRVEFEVMLPSRTSLGRGKKIALSNRLGPHHQHLALHLSFRAPHSCLFHREFPVLRRYAPQRLRDGHAQRSASFRF